MHTERLILQADASGVLPRLPTVAPNQRVEVILHIAELEPGRTRTPNPALRGTLRILGELDDAWTADEQAASLDRTARQIAGEPDAFEPDDGPRP